MNVQEITQLGREEFRRRCLKPDPERLGTWTARRWGRPLALYVTRFTAPHGLTAHHATLLACSTAAAACAAFAWGAPWAWFWGAVALHAWYVLDHVDGQLARLRRTASLDGTFLDYLMHHSVNLLLPVAIGFGLMRQTGGTHWCLLGMAWGWGSLVIGLRHDARYKAFHQRLKLLHGELHVVGGGGGRPEPAYVPRGSLRSFARWAMLKCYETHVVILSLTVLAGARLLLGGWGELALQIYLPAVALPAPFVAIYLVAQAVRRGEAEREFSAWFQVPAGATLEFRDGWWHIEPPAPTPGPPKAPAAAGCERASSAAAAVSRLS